MKRIKMNKKLAYVVFIALFVVLFTISWEYFGPFSLGAILSFGIIYIAMRYAIKNFFEFTS